MARSRYTQSKLFDEIRKQKLLGGKGVAKTVVPISAKKTGFDTNEGMIAAILKQGVDGVLGMQAAKLEDDDFAAARRMRDDYLKPQKDWNVEKDGTTPDALRAATMPGALTGNVGSQEMPIESYGAMGPDGMPAALGAPNAALGAPIDIEQPYAPGTDEEGDDANWMTPAEHKEFYENEALNAQAGFDKENPTGMARVDQGNYGVVKPQSLVGQVFGGPAPVSKEQPNTVAMRNLLMGDATAKRESDEERVRVAGLLTAQRAHDKTKADKVYGRDQADATLAHTRGMKVKRMERGLKLEDKFDELNERDRLATKRDETNRKHRAYLAAIKPYQSLGVPIPEHIIRPFQEAPRAAPSMISPPQDSTTASAAESVAAPAPNVPQNAPTGSPRASSGTSLMEAQANAAGKKAGAIELAKLKATAKADYPMVEHNSKFLLNALDAIVAPKLGEDGKPLIVDGKYLPGKEHAGLENFVGFRSPFGGAALMNLPFGPEKPIGGTNAADFEAKLGQVQGKLFLQAFETLKGGGQITEVEGEKATSALANLSASQSEEQFRAALLEFRYEVGELVKLARKRSGMDKTPSKAQLIAEAVRRGLIVQ